MNTSFICPGCNKKVEYGTCIKAPPEMCPECLMKKYSNIPVYKAGSQIGDYIILKQLGVGGMGEVFLAEQKSVKRQVALKILHPALSKNQQYLGRFFQEVRMLAQIEHPNIVQAIEAGVDGVTCYFSMMFISGKDLKAILDEGRGFSECEALQIIRTVACALDYAWKKHKLIHRDIKPANIMLTHENEVALMDLGISKSTTSDCSLTSPGLMMGSPAYVSPEQARSEKDIDCRADIYSLGATFYHIVTGIVPFESDNSTAVIVKQLTEKVPDPRTKNPHISEKSVNLIYKMMEKDKRDRFAGWQETIHAIDEILDPMMNQAEQQEPVPGRIPLSEAVKSKIPVCVRKTSPFRIASLCVLLILFLMAFGAVVKRSVKEAKYKKFNDMYESAMVLVKSGDREERFKAVALLERVIQSGFPDLSGHAANSMENLRLAAIAEKQKAFEARKLDALEKLKRKSFEFEEQNNYLKALDVWVKYKQFGEFKDEKIFQDAIAHSVEYLKTKQQQKEQGLSDD